MALEPVEGKLPSFRLDGRLAVITGASEGIGRAIALAYARSGAEVVLVSRRREKLLEVARSVGGDGGRAHVIRADIGRLKHSGALPKSPNFTHTTPVGLKLEHEYRRLKLGLSCRPRRPPCQTPRSL